MLLAIFRFFTGLYKSLSFIEVGRNTVLNPFGIKKISNSEIIIGNSSIIFGNLATEKGGSKIQISDRVFIGRSVLVASKSIIIEENVLISSNCFITDNDGHSLDYRVRRNDVINRLRGCKNWKNIKDKPVRICKNSWIGYGSIILKGVTIGEGSIVGAGSVVTSSVPPFTVVAGNPAKVLRRINHRDF